MKETTRWIECRKWMLKVARMRRVEYWNISWWVAMMFTIGSIVWVINGFVLFLPLLLPSRYAEGVSFGSWSAWVGATVFEIGAVLAMWEAWNGTNTADFGRNARDVWGRGIMDAHLPRWLHADKKGDRGEAMHFESGPLPVGPLHPSPPSGSRRGEEGSSWSSSSTTSAEKSEMEDGDRDQPYGGAPKRQRWVWFSMEAKYWRELGFLAAFTQFCGATIFWISGFTGLEGIQRKIEDKTAVLNGIYWLPQVVGGSGFIVSAIFLMLKTQRKWYIPRPLNLGWHIGFWNFVGAIGFTLCGALGFASQNSGAVYQSILSTYWGSWAFLIGSVAQWYECVNPVD